MLSASGKEALAELRGAELACLDKSLLDTLAAAMDAEPTAGSIFPRTDWAELSKAAEAEPAPLDRLIRLYWQPLKIFLVATFPSLSGHADELLQDFAGDKMLREGWLKKADQTRGRFRDFLKTSLRNFILDHLNRADVKNHPVSLEELELEIPETPASVEEFDLAWARAVLAETLRRMEADCRKPGKDQPRRLCIWEMFRIRLLEPVFNNAPQMPYDQLVEKFGLKSPLEASNTLLSAKRIFKGHLDEVIQDYAGQDAASALEVQALKDFLGRLSKNG
jgi:DNA-directed RNA polymerase specialized sigma24 family protein